MERFPATAPVVCFVAIFLGLQFTVSSASPAEINHDLTNSAAARNLKQEQERPHEVHCSRERSRAARQIIEESRNICLADLCGALHCDFVINSKSQKTKCNPAAAARNRHLCESLADTCFPVNQGLSASRLHELFLHQFCDAHTCSEKKKPFPRGGLKLPNILYLATSILTLMLLPFIYLIVFLHQRDMTGKQELKRIKKRTKPS
ncbi:hypothetical protein ACJRO7_008364 [Eucalyptus globulus]|uniref:Uncharacterized protein n=1 Tax=Eucalyptus globulus TaxID=34317 RepID=A0ABD3IRC1_EUCGL